MNSFLVGLLMVVIACSECLGEFVSSPSNLEVIAGHGVELPCHYENIDPTERVSWLKMAPTGSPRILVTGTHIFTKRLHTYLTGDHDAGEFNLKLNNVTPTDDGRYICQILGSEPQQEQIHGLLVTIPPYNIDITPDKVNKSFPGDSLNLQCTAGGKPPPTITWTKRNGQLPDGGNVYVGKNLTVNELTKADGGLYACIAANGIGEAIEHEITVEVYYEPDMSTPSNTIMHSGPNIDLKVECTFDSYPPVQNIHWIAADGQPVPNGFNINDGKNEVTSTLMIHVMEANIGENFTCRALYEGTYYNKTFTILGIPTKVLITSPEENSFGEQYSAVWKVISYSPVIEYKLKFRHIQGPTSNTSSAPNVLSVPAVESDMYTYDLEQSYTIEGLEPESTYELTVQARNMYGVGEVSDAKPFTTGKAGVTPAPEVPTTEPEPEKPMDKTEKPSVTEDPKEEPVMDPNNSCGRIQIPLLTLVLICTIIWAL